MTMHKQRVQIVQKSLGLLEYPTIRPDINQYNVAFLTLSYKYSSLRFLGLTPSKPLFPRRADTYPVGKYARNLPLPEALCFADNIGKVS